MADNKMSISIKDGLALINTPYHPDFVAKVKLIGGARWNGAYWSVPEAAADAVRQIMRQVYGYDDTMENETLTLRLTFTERKAKQWRPVTAYGKILAYASSRDSGARVGDDVAFIEGRAISGGSRNYWDSIVEKGSVVMLYNVNKNLYRDYCPKSGILVEVIDEDSERHKLMEERRMLSKRIETIDGVLEQMDKEKGQA